MKSFFFFLGGGRGQGGLKLGERGRSEGLQDCVYVCVGVCARVWMQGRGE